MENNDINLKMESALAIADKLLPLLPDYNVFHFSYYAKDNLGWDSKEVQKITIHAPYIKRLMIEQLKYVNEVTAGQWYELTAKGRNAKAAGGHYLYLKKIAEKELIENERQKLSDEKLKYDVKNAKRIFKTYWWTFSISILAFLLAVGKIIYDIISHN